MASSRLYNFVAISLLLARFTVAITCPENDGDVYIDEATGSSFIVECGTERPGGDLQGTGPYWVNSLEDCIGTCAANLQCVNVVYVPGTPGPCYIKSTLTLEELRGDLVGAHRQDVEGYRCPDADGQVVQVNPDSSWTLRCAWNYEGDGAAGAPILTTTFDKCIAQCERIDDCNFATFYAGQGLTTGSVVRPPGGKCVFHKTVSQVPSPIEGAWGGIRYSVCPDENGSIRTVGDKSYTVECETDRYGNDIGEPIFTDSYTSCLGECNANSQCVAVVWRHKTRACYLKNGEGTPVPSPGNIAGVPDKCVDKRVTTSTTTVASTTVTVGTGTQTIVTTNTPATFYPLLTLDQTSTPSPVPTSHGPKKCGDAKCHNGKKSCAATPRHYPTPSPPRPRKVRRHDTTSTSTTETVCTPTSTAVTTVYTATTTSITGGTCTKQTTAATTTTVAAICNPTLAYNRASLPTPIASALSQGKVKAMESILVDDKMSCCDECADTLNCVYWKWTPDSSLNPSGVPTLPGNCIVGYYAANNLADLCKKIRRRSPSDGPNGNSGRGGARGRKDDDDDDTVIAAVCPNGGFVSEGAVSTVSWGTLPDPAAAYAGSGFNPGACGGAEGLWATGTWDGKAPGAVDNCDPAPATTTL